MRNAPAETVTGYACLACGRLEPPESARLVCPACGENLDILYDYDRIARAVDPEKLRADPVRTILRYRALLPLREEVREPALRVGGGGLLPAPRLGDRIGLASLFLLDDTTNPSASFKDRASVVAALRGREIGARTISCASTGNAASSLAWVSAALGLGAAIFVPEKAPIAKLTQILLYGARVFRVRGTYDDAFDLCLAATERFGWYTRSTGVNPFTVEGKKTAAYEIAESLGWKSPDWIFVPTGDGNILGGVAKGFREMRRLGWVDREPRLAAVQAEGCAPLADAWRSGSETPAAVVPRTIADSIAVGRPRDARRALRAVRETNGRVVAVSDDAILGAMRELPASAGLFAEPSAAASLAGLRKALADGTVAPSESVVLLITGSGLKDIATASRLGAEPPLVEPDLVHLERAMKKGAGPVEQ